MNSEVWIVQSILICAVIVILAKAALFQTLRCDSQDCELFARQKARRKYSKCYITRLKISPNESEVTIRISDNTFLKDNILISYYFTGAKTFMFISFSDHHDILVFTTEKLKRMYFF